MTEERSTIGGPETKLALVLHLPAAPTPVPCVIACHGLGASKDSDKYLLLGAEFPRVGLALARFDFRGCGESSGIERETTIATRLEDLATVFGFLASHPRLDGRWGLLGSSLGGFVALHAAAKRADRIPIVTWNTPCDLKALRDRRHDPSLGPAFLAEVGAGRYVRAPAGIPRHLVVQSEADEVVPTSHGQMLRAWAGPDAALVVIAEGDHRLTDPAHRRRALEASLAWFRPRLGALP